MKKKIFLSIAASDSIGGAGIQADNRTASMLGLYPVNVVTAITAQNSLGVVMVEPVPMELVICQLDCILQDFKPDCVKIGFLPTSECIKEIALMLEKYKLSPIVLDPVLSPTRGSFDNSENLGKHLIESFAGITTLITPNLQELEKLNSETGDNIQSLFKATLIKGGHAGGNSSNDLLIVNDPLGSKREISYESVRIDTPNTHGSGCVLSSAIACYLGLGMSLEEAVSKAKDFLCSHLQANSQIRFGQGGYGPVIC